MPKIKEELIVINKQGLHARPASLFVQIANKYESKITVKKDKQKVNGKSIMGILTLEAGKGSKVTIEAAGEDAKQALDELKKIILSQNC